MSSSPIIVISGCTASGKSNVALKLAKRINGVILNADSRQIYKELLIGTAKPSEEDRLLVPHHLVDIINPDEEFTLYDFQKMAMETILDFEGRGIEFLDYFQVVYAGKLPIVHGHEFKSISTSVNPARGLFLKANSWVLGGHSHRTSEHTGTNIKGDYLTTWSVGCLCDLHPEYNPFGNQWNWGLAIVENKENGDFEVENKRILPNGKVV